MNERLADAIFTGDEQAAVKALAKGGDPNGLVNGRHCMLGYAVIHTNNLNIYKALLSAGADVSRPVQSILGGQRRLSAEAAIRQRRLDVVAFLTSAEERYTQEVGPLPSLPKHGSCPIKKTR